MTRFYIIRENDDELELLLFHQNNICQNLRMERKIFEIWKMSKQQVNINGKIKESELNDKSS